MNQFLLAVFFIFTTHAHAEEKNWGGLERMNGIALKDFAGFEKNWQLVTVRYRKDTGEMRFTYANPIAMKAIVHPTQDYPDGAVFAKIGFITGEDRAFPSSMVPNGARRFQFMVRDKKKFTETDGWGYALFTGSGVTYNEEPRQASIACHACHKIVPDRGFVFSEPADLNPFVSAIHGKGSGFITRLAFRDGTAAELPAKLRARLPKSIQKMKFLAGEIQRNLFSGTLDEIKPALAAEVLKSGLPCALMSNDGKSFVVVYPSDETELSCAKTQSAIELKSTTSIKPAESTNPESQILTTSFCWK